jgi:hypothetical protein
MAEGARIHSVEALSIFRAALIKFAEAGNVALGSADGDIDRVLGWLERDQTVYWAGQVRKRHALVLQWEDAMRQKRLYKNVDGTTKSAVDEQKEWQKAKRAEEEAKQKEAAVRKAIMTLRKESMMYKGRVQRLATSLSSDIPAAVRSLDTMVGHLEAYLQVQTTGEGISLGDGAETISRAALAEKVGLERFRSRTPTPQQRQAAVFTEISPDHPLHQPWKAGVTQDWQSKALATLSIDRQLPDLESRVVLYPQVWGANRIYLERLEPGADLDSGWYIGSGDDGADAVDESKLIAVRLADLLSARKDFADLLGMPASTLVILDAGGPAAIFDGLGLDIWSLALTNAGEPASGDSATADKPPTSEPPTSEPPTSEASVST